MEELTPKIPGRPKSPETKESSVSTRRKFLTNCVAIASAITATAAQGQARTIRTKETYKFTFVHEEDTEVDTILMVTAKLKCTPSEAKFIQEMIGWIGKAWDKKPEDWVCGGQIYGAWEK